MRILFRLLLMISIAPLAEVASAQAQIRSPSLQWRIFEIPEFGTTLDYPAGIFTPSGAAPKGVGQEFHSPGGRAALSIYSRENQDGETPATYLRTNLRVSSSTLDYERVTGSFFAVSMERDGLVYYSRCNFSSGFGGVIHCFDIVYPQEEKRAWDPVVTRMSLSLRPRGG
jgi:hypothetical protein